MRKPSAKVVLVLVLFPISQSVADVKGPPAVEEAAKGKQSVPLTASWNDDFTLSTPDGTFLLKIRGNMHLDSKFYGAGSASVDTFDLRRARMDFQGVLYTTITFRVQAELADSPYVRNAFADFKIRDWIHLRGGQMKPPFSTSWWTLDNRVNFLERGANTPIYPYFDRGWWLWGDLLGKRLTWNLAGFNGTGMDFDTPRGDVDDHKDWFGRIFLRPFAPSNTVFLQGLHFCVEGSRGRQSIPTKRFEMKGYGAAVRDDTFWTWQTESPGHGTIDRRDRWGAELHGIWGPVSVSSEYLVARYDDIKVYATDGTLVLNESGAVTSWSTWASWFLTGEHKQVDNFGWRQPKPLAWFNPAKIKGPGAWEVLFRFTRTDTDDNLFMSASYGGAVYRILSGASEIDEVTAGVNWTWNPMVRWQFNYVHLQGDGIRSGAADTVKGTAILDDEDMFGVRLILKF